MSNQELYKMPWSCPVCYTTENLEGKPFTGARAVACHIAGKARKTIDLHRSWAINKVPGINLKDNILNIGQSLLWPVEEARREQEASGKIIIVESTRNKEPSDKERIDQIELRLHKFIEKMLKTEFGESEDGWWVNGISINIRKECAMRREEDKARKDLYVYLDLIDLKSILDKNWKLFEANFSHVSGYKSKHDFLKELVTLSEIRNRIAHPARLQKEPLSDEERQFLTNFDKQTLAFCFIPPELQEDS